MEFQTELLGTWDQADAPYTVVSVEGLVRCRFYEQATGGGYGARPREVRTSGYQSVPVDVMRADQAMVSGRVGWTSRATTVGPSRSSESRMQTAPDGRR